jgi:tRNA A37 threonylcarbamoyladenosine biosynthesis protein TsaE
MLIEWAEKLVNLPKEDFLEVKIQYVDETIRSISLIGYGEWLELLKALERDVESGI